MVRLHRKNENMPPKSANISFKANRNNCDEDEMEPENVDRDYCVILTPVQGIVHTDDNDDHDDVQDHEEMEGGARRRTSAPTGTAGGAPPPEEPARATESRWPGTQTCCCPENSQPLMLTPPTAIFVFVFVFTWATVSVCNMK